MVAGNIGVGLYEGATSFPAVWLYLVHRNGLASAIRRDRSQALIGLRADVGKDDMQMSWGQPAVAAADEFVDRFIIPAVERAGIGVYDFCLGPNEHYGGGLGELQYRATAESRIMRRVQYGEGMPDWWEPLAYAWGGIAVGQIEPSEVVLFRDLWLHAWAVNYHGYLGPGRTSLAQETDDYYLWRPLKLWLPALRGLGWVGPKRPLRILLGECGTYTSDLLPADARARLAVVIGREFGRRSAGEADVCFVGPCAYSFGAVGDQVSWRLDGQEKVFEAATVGETPPNQPTIPPDGGEPVAGDYAPATWRSVVNHEPRVGHLPVAVCFHRMDGYLANCFGLFNSPMGDASAHYGVGKSGTVEQYVAEADAAWGSGIWNHPNLSNRFLADAFNDQPPTNSNQILIHVELEDYPAGTTMPAAQYAALLALVRDIFKRHAWPVGDSARYIRHSDIDSVTRAKDPGVYLNLAQLRADMAAVQPKPPADLTPELARLYVLSASLAQLAADVKAKVGA